MRLGADSRFVADRGIPLPPRHAWVRLTGEGGGL